MLTSDLLAAADAIRTMSFRLGCSDAHAGLVSRLRQHVVLCREEPEQRLTKANARAMLRRSADQRRADKARLRASHG